MAKKAKKTAKAARKAKPAARKPAARAAKKSVLPSPKQVYLDALAREHQTTLRVMQSVPGPSGRLPSRTSARQLPSG